MSPLVKHGVAQLDRAQVSITVTNPLLLIVSRIVIVIKGLEDVGSNPTTVAFGYERCSSVGRALKPVIHIVPNLGRTVDRYPLLMERSQVRVLSAFLAGRRHYRVILNMV